MIKFETKYYYLFKECLHYFFHLCRYNASVKTDNDCEKMQYTLLRENHVIEKGLSLRNPRIGFGKDKVLKLIARLEKYNSLYSSKDKQFLYYPLTTIAKYIDYQRNNNADINEVESRFMELINKCSINREDLILDAGVKEISKIDGNHDYSSFEELVKTRHSVRYFSREVPSDDLIDRALEIAQQTPSACNRQGWETHIFYTNQSEKLLKWQGGARGFEQEPTMSILVTANSKAFLKYEPFQAYVDGGLYAMNLTNALHSLGLGSIPLSCGFGHVKLRQLYAQFDIPKNEVPIVIIAVGCLEEKYRIAISKRKPIAQTTTKHKEAQ